jgi:predicted RND superfamily exporter protein
MSYIVELIKKHNLIVIIVFSILFLITLFGIKNLEYERTLTQYLPRTSEYVQAYFDIEEDFGGGEIGLIGIRSDDVLSKESLKSIKKIEEGIKGIKGVNSVFSIFDAMDFVSKPEGLEINPLIKHLDLSEDEKEYIRKHPDYSGAIISENGKATAIVVRIKEREIIEAVKEIKNLIEKEKGLEFFYSGSPFVSTYIISAVRRDIEKISPIVALFTLFLLSYFFRNITAVFVSILTVCTSVIMVFGLMGIIGEPISIVNSSIPALLFAVSSAYAVHTFRGFSSTTEVEDYLKNVGVPIFFSAITTAAGFFFLFIMEMHAIRFFGILVSTGVLISAFISIILIPSVFVWMKRYPRGWSVENPLLERIAGWLDYISQNRYVKFLIPFFLILLFIKFLPELKYKTEEESFFKKGSEPLKGMEFFNMEFGGADYLMVRVKGDFSKPSTVLFVDTISTLLSGVKGVKRVDSFSNVLKRAQKSMTGVSVFPLTSSELNTITFFVEGEKEVKGLYNKDKGSTLILARGDADLWEDEYKRIKDSIYSLLSAYKIGKRKFFLKRIEIFNLSRGIKVDPQEVYSSLEKGGISQINSSIVQSALNLNPDIFTPLPPEDIIMRLTSSIKRGVVDFKEVCHFYNADEDLCYSMKTMFLDSLDRVQKINLLKDVGGFFFPSLSEDEILYLLSPFFIEWETSEIEVSFTSSSLIMKEIEKEMRKGQIISTILSAFFSIILLFLLSGDVIILIYGVISSIFPFLILWTFYSITGISVDMGSLLVPSVSIGLCIDYSVHSFWARRFNTDFKLLTLAIIMNALSVGGGFAGMVFSSVRPTLKFGLGASFTVLVGAIFAIIYFREVKK